MGFKFTGRAPSPRELRRQEAQRLDGLDAAELRAALGETTWTEAPNWSARLLWTPTTAFMFFLPLAGVTWAISGRNPFNEAHGPPGVFGWAAITFLIALGYLLPALLLMVWRCAWMRLDSTGISRRGIWLLRPPPPTTYRWEDCGDFKVREVPVSNGRSAAVVECIHRDGPLVLNDYYFGEPSDVVKILNAYRSVYRRTDSTDTGVCAERTDVDVARETRSAPSPAVLRGQEAQLLDGLSGSALRAAVGESLWTSSRSRYKWSLGIIAVCGVVMAALFVTALFAGATEPIDGVERVVVVGGVVGILGFIGGCFLWSLVRFLRPPQVQLDSTGITITGARFIRRSPRRYGWGECGPFTLHTISGEVDRLVARCELRRGDLKFEDIFGDPYDLVTILNAYRSVYGVHGTAVTRTPPPGC